MELHFGRDNWTTQVYTPLWGAIRYDRLTSNADQDRLLLQLWEDLQEDTESGRVPGYMGPLFNPLYNCWWATEEFDDFPNVPEPCGGRQPRPAYPTEPSRPGGLPGPRP